MAKNNDLMSEVPEEQATEATEEFNIVEATEVADTTEEQETVEEAAAEEEQEAAQKKHRSIALIISSAAVALVVVAVIVGFTLADTPDTRTITENDTPLASLNNRSSVSSGSGSSGTARSSGSGSSEDSSSETGSSGAAQENSGSSNSSGSNGSGGNAGGGTSPGGGSPDPVWVPGWEEQVWVDTSGYQSVHVGDNPIYETLPICSSCNRPLFGNPNEHLGATGHGSWSLGQVQTGSTPVYEDQWVSSGYWSTVYHDGYWK